VDKIKKVEHAGTGSCLVVCDSLEFDLKQWRGRRVRRGRTPKHRVLVEKKAEQKKEHEEQRKLDLL